MSDLNLEVSCRWRHSYLLWRHAYCLCRSMAYCCGSVDVTMPQQIVKQIPSKFVRQINSHCVKQAWSHIAQYIVNDIILYGGGTSYVCQGWLVKQKQWSYPLSFFIHPYDNVFECLRVVRFYSSLTFGVAVQSKYTINNIFI